MFNRDEFAQYNKKHGPFDLDACCDDQGVNAHVARFCSPSNSFLDTDVAGQRIWANFPFDQ
ncbi:MAG: hypothetical protein ACRDL7_14615, partial [Gaiellaceae bacterium]